MGKNNYLIEKEKQIARLRQKVMVDSAYIGAGCVLCLSEMKFTDDQIEEFMNHMNEIWTHMAENRINPLTYCEEKTGFKLITEQEEIDTINEYFDE